jgi:uncharacterized membrane protein YbaN (DUF454 family)
MDRFHCCTCTLHATIGMILAYFVTNLSICFFLLRKDRFRLFFLNNKMANNYKEKIKEKSRTSDSTMLILVIMSSLCCLFYLVIAVKFPSVCCPIEWRL